MARFAMASINAVVMPMLIVLLVLWLFNPYECQAHVALTFPPARPYAIDFLDNLRTPGPCGMPRGLGKSLTLLSGATYVFTWNMPNLHPGGLRLELLDRDYNLIATLAPTAGEATNGDFHFANSSNPTTIFRQITLPADVECVDCVVRLLRQSGPWPPGVDAGYLFRSCADVHVRKLSVTKRDVCANRGTYNVTQRQCVCDGQSAGSSCQHQQECLTDSDCSGSSNGGGRCLTTDSVSYPRRQCFCSPGFYGIHCEHQSSINVGELSSVLTKYQHKMLPSGFDLMWRYLSDLQELEVVVRGKTMSWVAIGMRAPEATVACRQFPALPIERVRDARAYNDNKGIARRKSSFSTQQQNSILFRNSVADSGFHSNAPSPALLDADVLHAMDCTDIVWGAAKGSLSRVRDMYTRERAMPQLDEFFGGQQSLTGATAFELNGRTTLIFRRRLTSNHPTDAAISDAMMHVTVAHGQPPDTNPLPELDDPAFSSIFQPNSVQQQTRLSISDYYRLDELKYHGYGSMQRAATSINFLAGATAATVPAKKKKVIQEPIVVNATFYAGLPTRPCFGQFRMPSQCAPNGVATTVGVVPTCLYAAEWYYDATLRGLRVSLFSSQPDKWLGIGWSRTGEMPNSHITTAWIGTSSRAVVTDRFAYGRFMPAKIVTSSQNAATTLLGGRRAGDRAMAVEFVKPLGATNVSKKAATADAPFNLADASCYYLLFPVHGGAYNEADESIGKHTSTPIVSNEKVCFNACTAAAVNNNSNNNNAAAVEILSGAPAVMQHNRL